MPRNPLNKRIPLVLSPAQHKALTEYAERHNIDAAEAVRQILALSIVDFPDDLKRRGKYERNK